MLLIYAIVIFLILMVFYYYAVEDLRDKPIKKFQDIELKTGDIFFTHCDYITLIEPFHFTVLNLLNNVCNGGVETHVGIVVRKNNKPWIYQVEYKPTYDQYTQSWRWKAPMIMDPEKYFMEYCGEIIYYPVKNELDINKTWQFIEDYQKHEFTVNQVRWINTYMKLPLDRFFSEDPPKRFCVQLVSEYLNYMQVLYTSYEPQYMNFQDLKADMQFSGIWNKPFILDNIYTSEMIKLKN